MTVAYRAELCRQCHHRPDDSMIELRSEHAIELGEGEFSRAVSGRDPFQLPLVFEASDHRRDLAVRRADEVKPPEDGVDARIDVRRCLEDLFDARMRTSNHQRESLRRLHGHGDFVHLLGAADVRHRREQP